MAEERVQRRLAAILFADVVGYSRLMREDENGTLAQLKTLRNELLNPKIEEFGGRVVKTVGDGVLVEFLSAVDAVQHAIDVQRAMRQRNTDVPEDRRIEFRIGINVGDVIVEGDDLYGDGVNIASRIEGLAETGGICISSSAHEQVRHKLALEYQDMGEQSLKNIADPVHVYRVAIAGGEDATRSLMPSSDGVFRRPAVAVLPFENLSGDPEQEYFADGLTEDIITALSHWRFFPVIARNSTFAYKGKSPDIRKVGEELGARYVVEGSVRKVGSRVRITSQLINAETGHHVWAEKYDRDLEDIFALQDEITLRIAAIIEPAITSSEQKRISSKPPNNPNAWDLCIQGYFHIYEGTKESNEQAKEKFEQAIALDPNYGRAWTGLAYTYSHELRLRLTASPETSRQKLMEAARMATALDDTDSEAHAMLARAYYNAGQSKNGDAEIRRAIELNPQNAGANMLLGARMYYDGTPEEGIPWLEKALEINPIDPRNFIMKTHLASAYLCAGDYEKSSELARDATRQRSTYIDSHVVLAAALGYLGRTDEAQQAAEAFRDKAEDFVENHPFYCRDTKDRFLGGLRKARLLD